MNASMINMNIILKYPGFINTRMTPDKSISINHLDLLQTIILLPSIGKNGRRLKKERKALIIAENINTSPIAKGDIPANKGMSA